MTFWYLCSIVTQRKWIIVACCILTVIATGIASLFIPREYRAKAVLLPSERTLRRVAIEGDATKQPQIGERESQQANLIALAKTNAVAANAIRKLKVPMRPHALLRRITVKPLQQDDYKGNVDLFEIWFSDKDPAFAVSAVNATAEAFITTYNEITHREARRAIDMLSKEAKDMKKDLNVAGKELAAWRVKTNITALPEQVQAALSEIGPARAAYNLTKAQLSQVEGKIRGIRTQLLTMQPTRTLVEGSSFSLSNSPTYKQLLDTEAQLADLSLKYKTSHPRIQALLQLEKNLREKLRAEQNDVHLEKKILTNTAYLALQDELSNLSAERTALVARASTEGASVQSQSKMLSKYSGMDIELDFYVRKYKSAEEAYNAVVAKLNQAKINQDMAGNSGAIEIVDRATTAEGPIRKGPDNFQLLFAAAIFGLAIGVGFVILNDMLDDSIKTPLEAEELLSLPVTGVIPSLPSNIDEKNVMPARITEISPSSSYSEAYRFLAMDLLLNRSETRPKVMMMATPKPGQGGTTTAINLAISLAQGGESVVLIDADGRRPSLHKIFSLSNRVGLSSILQDNVGLSMALQQTSTKNLQLLAAGPIVENPWSLLRSDNMRKLISSLRELADFVIIDTPSAMVFPDALAISEFVDGAIFVIRSHDTLGKNELQLKAVFNKAQVPIIGVVLNDVPPEHVSSCQYYDHYYSSKTVNEADDFHIPALESDNSDRLA